MNIRHSTTCKLPACLRTSYEPFIQSLRPSSSNLSKAEEMKVLLPRTNHASTAIGVLDQNAQERQVRNWSTEAQAGSRAVRRTAERVAIHVDHSRYLCRTAGESFSSLSGSSGSR